MNDKTRKLKQTMMSLQRWRLMVWTLALIVLIIILWWLLFAAKDNRLGIEVDQSINITPEQIQSIKAIGEWEFLAVSNEELVDTVRKGLIHDDQLVRIYYGTLRLGINMHQVKPGWIQVRGDSVTVTLPKVQLLDRDFIDEARTKAFYESGRWTPADREALFRKAYRMMLAHCLTPENLRSAENNADVQFRRMMKAMGFNHIVIKFEV